MTLIQRLASNFPRVRQAVKGDFDLTLNALPDGSPPSDADEVVVSPGTVVELSGHLTLQDQRLPRQRITLFINNVAIEEQRTETRGGYSFGQQFSQVGEFKVYTEYDPPGPPYVQSRTVKVKVVAPWPFITAHPHIEIQVEVEQES